MTAHLRSQVLSKDVKNQLIEVNEAFLVLSDKELKRKYDYSLSSNSQDTTLLSGISLKHERAVQFVSEKLDNAPKKRKKEQVASDTLWILSSFSIRNGFTNMYTSI